MKIVTLNPDEFDQFAKVHKYRSYYQTSNYAEVMKHFGFNVHLLGFTDDNNNLIGATLLLFKEVFMGNKVAYAPRGLLFDYTNSSNLNELVTKLKQVLGKQGFALLRIDPLIPSSIRDSKGNIININNNTDHCIGGFLMRSVIS